MSKSEILVYMAGAMSYLMEQGRYDEARGWRDRLRSKFEDVGIKVFDPTRNSIEHYSHPEHYSEGVVYQNKVYIDRSDVLLVNLEKLEESIGTIWEVSMCWARHIPVVAFGKCDKWSERPHFKSMFTVVCEDEEEAVDYIISMYGGMI